VGNLHGVGGAPRPLGWLAPTLTSLGLSMLFLVIYGGTNWITSLRSHVGTWVFEWEHKIAFVPIMIIPYMSIDLFFVAAPYVCRDRVELATLARRIAFVIVVAGICFLIMPLRLTFTKPEVDGWLGVIFTTFCEMDKPFNLFPSLHIALQTILMAHYARHSTGVLRLALLIWFAFIGASTVMTFQHHLVDVAGGLVLGIASLYLFREVAQAAEATRNLRIALYYGAASAALMGLAALVWPWGWLLVWPIVSLAIAAGGYCGPGARIFCKCDGVLPWPARIVLAPLLLGQHLSLVYYRRQCRAWDEVVANVLIGRVLTDAEAEVAMSAGVTAVLDLTGEFSEARPLLKVAYLNIPILDLTAPTSGQVRLAVEFITLHAMRGKVYVHCKIGYSRSAAIVGAYLLAAGHVATAREAVDLLCTRRPTIVIRAEAMEVLSALERDHKPRENRDLVIAGPS
jgi:membrane-associated phospholipid phosphatase